MPASDADLLRLYAHERSEAAFAEIVRRHVNLVYGAAKRQVRSAALAEEVTQSVFVDLARHAGSLGRDNLLVAWLHVVTRRTAIDVIRHESRRRAREQAAQEVTAMDSPSSFASEMEPFLDEAISKLNGTDRAAVLLRFFENKSLNEVGATLGMSDDAAQKRVSRALVQLRSFLVRRGVTISAAGLTTQLTAHIILPAPPALVATIASAAAHAPVASILSSAFQTLTMTTLQKTLVATVLVLALGSTVYEARVIMMQTAELRAHRDREDQLVHSLDALKADRDARARQLADALDQLATERAKSAQFASADPAIEAALDTWLQNVVRLKRALEKTLSSQIPELRYLTAKDWLDATKENSIESDMDVRAALSQLRSAGKLRFSTQLAEALHRYLKANNSQPPGDTADLAPFFESPADPAILQRYGIVSEKDFGPNALRFTAKDGTPVRWVIREKNSVDPYYDTTFQFSSNGFGYTQSSQFDQEVDAAITSFKTANNNAAPAAPSQLAPYLHSAIDPAFIQKRLDQKD